MKCLAEVLYEIVPFCLGQNDYSSGRCFCLSGLLQSLVQTVVRCGTVGRWSE